jgi:hypothetical protein
VRLDAGEMKSLDSLLKMLEAGLRIASLIFALQKKEKNEYGNNGTGRGGDMIQVPPKMTTFTAVCGSGSVGYRSF